MPMPNFVRHVNKYVFNRWELRRGKRPILIHTGRTSRQTYRTPLEPMAVDGGYVFVLMYGADATDWVQNVLTDERAALEVDGEQLELVNPQIFVGDEGWAQVPTDNRPPDFLKVSEILRMDIATTGGPPVETGRAEHSAD